MLLLGASAVALISSASAHAATVQAGQTTGQPTTGKGAPTTAPASEPQDAANAGGQTTNADGTPRTADVPDGEEVTVTGSRIRVPGITSFSAITTVNNEYINDRGLTNAADALNEIPGIRGSVTPNGAQGSFGQGVNFINYFNLGSNRTLTLINGRRVVSSNVNTIFGQGSAGTQVDANIVPTLLLDRVESLTANGAAIYGSDAIAATVNFILDTRLNGVKANVLTGFTEQGDAFRYNAAIAGGFNFDNDRGNVTVAYTRDQQDGVLGNNRSFLRDNITNATNPTTAQAAALGRPAGVTFANDGRLNPNIGYNDTTSDGFPGSVLIRNRTIPSLTEGGLITAASRGTTFTTANNVAAVTSNFQFDAAGNLIPFNRGIRFVGATEASGGDGFRFNDYVQIQSKLRRDIVNAYTTYTFSDAFEVFAEGTYFRLRGDELVQQPTFNSSLFGGTSGALTFTTDSPFLTAQARQTLVANGVSRFQVSRASIDLADLTGYSTNNLYRLVGGVRGKFQIGDRDFDYEASGNFGRNEVTDVGQDLNAQRFINAVNVTRNAAGQIVCTATPTVQAAPGGTPVADAACVPLNLLGKGLSDPAARAYVISENVTRSLITQQVYNANVGGSPFDIFGNKVAFNIGYEHRRETGSFTPSQFQQLGLGRSVAITPVRGRYTINEGFGELNVPLVTADNGLSFLHQLTLNAAGRYVDNTVNGGFFAWTAGGTIAPIRDVLFRGNYTRSFRAPAITELFSPITNAFSTVTDICSPANRNAGVVPEIRARNCTAFLAAFPNATPLDAASATVPSRSGGNPNLDNEVGKTYTLGVVLQPRFVPGLVIQADYTNIKIRNPITSLTVPTIVGACFDNANFNTADPANGNAFCSQIRRYAAGQGGTAANGGDRGGQVVVDPANPAVTSGFVNGLRIEFEGIQAQVNYSRPLSGLNIPGRIGVTGYLLVNLRRLVDTTGVAPARSDGTLGDPQFQGLLQLRYQNDDFGIASSFNYTGEQLFSRFNRTTDTREIDQLKDFVTINPSFWVNATDRFRFTFAVTNLLNRYGQKYYGTYIPASLTATGGDQLGRRFSVAAAVRF